MNYYILLELGDKNDIIQNQYNGSDEFNPEDKGRITDLISSLFSRISNYKKSTALLNTRMNNLTINYN